MSKYEFVLTDYKAIADANIHLDGLTILTGENGCGKSTIARWLYYLVNGIVRFHQDVLDEFVAIIVRQSSDLEQYASLLSRDFEIRGIVHREFFEFRLSVEETLYRSEASFHEVQKKFEQLLHKFTEDLVSFFDSDALPERKKRLSRILEIKDKEEIEEFVEKVKKTTRQELERLLSISEKRDLQQMFSYIYNKYREDNAPEDKVQLMEEGEKLMNNGQLSILLNLERAFYIDTPMFVGNRIKSDNPFWNEVHDALLDNPQGYDSNQISGLLKPLRNFLRGELLEELRNLLGGEIQISQLGIKRTELRFVSNDKQVDIALDKAATGFKTFSYLYRLLENGALNDKTMLIIDEPEVHLHPQWIVEYARLLVLLHKYLGVKIMLASHSPDMVSALQSIAIKEGVSEQTNFYLAKPCPDSTHRYHFHHLGTEIEPIFESFNIALDRIALYGTY